MHHFFARKTRRSNVVPTRSPPSYVRENLEPVIVLDRKIHPDINLLAEELAAAFDASKAEAEVHKEKANSSHIDAAGFVGLEPSARRKGNRKKDNKLELDVGKIEKDVVVQSLSGDSPTHSSTQPNLQCQIIQSSGSLMRWPTFGSRSRALQTKRKQQSADSHVYTKSASQSSLDQSQYFGSETESQQHSTPSYRGPKTSTLPSPHIFGPQTPNRSESDHDESYFSFKELPPPLPPLNHPAFRKGPPSSFKYPIKKYDFPVVDGGESLNTDNDIGLATRQTSYSLPSMTGSRRKRSIRDSQEYQVTRSRLRSNAGAESYSEAKAYIHSRQQSKTSIATSTGSRRSSAEYSAKQASSIGEDLHKSKMRDGCWEVDVSRAMICLALGKEEGVETRTVAGSSKTRRGASPSSLGIARGQNRASGGSTQLGSPFFLQDTHRDNLTSSQSFQNDPACITSSDQSHNLGAALKIHAQSKDMSNGGSVLQTSSSAKHATRKGKERAGTVRASSPKGSRLSGVGRAISSPSLTPASESGPARLDISSIFGSLQGSSTLQPPQLSITKATPEASPISPATRRGHHKSTPTMPTASVLRTSTMASTVSAPGIEKSYSGGSGKRKADEAGVGGDKTPPKESKEAKTTFAPEPRTHRASATSSGHAPSSYNRSKRVRLTDASDGKGSYRSSSRAGSLPTPNDSPPNAKNTGSWSSRASQSSHHYGPPPAPSASHTSHSNTQHQKAASRRSLSQASIPISALISPHAPSISRQSTFHMRDPRKPSPIQSTPWSLSWPSSGQAGESRWSWRGWVERGGSPLHAWIFFIGFILFPLWWAAALFIPIPKTRRLGEAGDAEKGVVLDDPQVEHDAKSWRTRCRVMAGVSLLTYVPFIVLVAIYA